MDDPQMDQVHFEIVGRRVPEGKASLTPIKEAIAEGIPLRLQIHERGRGKVAGIALLVPAPLLRARRPGCVECFEDVEVAEQSGGAQNDVLQLLEIGGSCECVRPDRSFVVVECLLQ